MDRVRDSSKNPPRPKVTFCQVNAIQVHETKNVESKILGLSGVIHVFTSNFRQEDKNVPRTFFERPKSVTTKNRKNNETPVNSVKSDIFDT